jgi:DNA-binding transcriptional regulator YhcF (GntR family)
VLSDVPRLSSRKATFRVIVLRGQIATGRLSGRVPSILSLAQEHGVSHRTAARALTTLRDEGLIISVRGKGYYVR